ncbi:MAG: hypothetical protein JSU86_20440 [Phycisphaerales bacterium]|nr:MAG: hypothetical protein JSU86_20440 [Phycisphaerales bacterium]
MQSLNVISAIWLSIASGTGLTLVATGLGWAVAQMGSIPPVRWVAWWVRAVVLPLLRCRFWWRRTVVIFANNISLLAALVAVGRWRLGALMGVAGLGVGLGIGLRILSSEPTAAVDPGPKYSARVRRRIRVGIVLNLLEPPAIMLTIGLSLARQPLPLSPGQVWETFLVWVVPATLLAAGGEALWLGAIHEARPRGDSGPAGQAGPGPGQCQGGESTD